MIDHKHKFIFVHISKTGGTSIEKTFIDSANKKDVEYKHDTIRDYKNKFPKEFEEYFKFSFVRNPWDWLVSRYHWSKNRQKLFDYSFEEMLHRISNKIKMSDKADWLDELMAPQSDRLLINGKIAVDFVGKFENLQEDYDKICDKIKIRRIKLPHVFKTKHEHYSKYYTPKTRKLVSKLYKQDIDLFGYQFEKK